MSVTEMKFAGTPRKRFLNFLAAIIATVRNFVVLIVPSSMFFVRHELQIFDAIVGFVSVTMMNDVTFGNVAEMKTLNCFVK